MLLLTALLMLPPVFAQDDDLPLEEEPLERIGGSTPYKRVDDSVGYVAAMVGGVLDWGPLVGVQGALVRNHTWGFGAYLHYTEYELYLTTARGASIGLLVERALWWQSPIHGNLEIGLGTVVGEVAGYLVEGGDGLFKSHVAARAVWSPIDNLRLSAGPCLHFPFGFTYYGLGYELLPGGDIILKFGRF